MTYLPYNVDDAIVLVHNILSEITASFLGLVSPVLLGEPLLDESGFDEGVCTISTDELVDEGEAESLRHVTQIVLVPMVIVQLEAFRITKT